VIFSSDVDSSHGSPNFELYVVDASSPVPLATAAPELERVTHFEGFDGLPTFSPDGSHLVFASSRHGGKPGAINLFLARWVE
jgi:Tol biopolymer transport system component